jgi:hypothetical protein
MNTIIINKILMHMLDFEHRHIYYSDEFVDLNETSIEYYKKKVEKALYSSTLKELTVGSLHEMLLRSKQMIESDEQFIAQAKEITDKLYALGSVIEEMPNCNVLIVDCYKDGERYIAILKLNYRYIPFSVVEEGSVRITRKQVLPTQGSAVDEAVIINVDTSQLSLIEKKYLIDGRNDYYLNTQWIKGEEKLTDKQKYNTMKRVVNKLDDMYHVNEVEALPLMKQEVASRMENHLPIKPLSIVKKVLERDYQAQEESELMLKDMGIDENDEIYTVTGTMEKCKLVLDTDIEINVSIDDYVNGENIKKEVQSDGTINIILKNINDIQIR